MIQGQCHCGNITLEIPELTETGTSCNCSICSRYGSIWGYFEPGEVKVAVGSAGMLAYSHGDKQLEFNSCKQCGCQTHYSTTEACPHPRVAVNYRMFGIDAMDQLTVRLFDGADTWKFLE